MEFWIHYKLSFILATHISFQHFKYYWWHQIQHIFTIPIWMWVLAIYCTHYICARGEGRGGEKNRIEYVGMRTRFWHHINIKEKLAAKKAANGVREGVKKESAFLSVISFSPPKTDIAYLAWEIDLILLYVKLTCKLFFSIYDFHVVGILWWWFFSLQHSHFLNVHHWLASFNVLLVLAPNTEIWRKNKVWIVPDDNVWYDLWRMCVFRCSFFLLCRPWIVIFMP